MLAQDHDLRELLLRHVVEALVGMEHRPGIRHSGQVGVDQVEDRLLVQANVLRTGLLVVADDDGAVGRETAPAAP